MSVGRDRNAKDRKLNGPVEEVIPPQALPTQIRAAAKQFAFAHAPDKGLFVIQADVAGGTVELFFPVAVADKVAQAMLDAHREFVTGLAVPPRKLEVPGR